MNLTWWKVKRKLRERWKRFTHKFPISRRRHENALQGEKHANDNRMEVCRRDLNDDKERLCALIHGLQEVTIQRDYDPKRYDSLNVRFSMSGHFAHMLNNYDNRHRDLVFEQVAYDIMKELRHTRVL